MRITSTNSVDLELHGFGGSGPTLLMIHANGLCAGVLRPMAAALAARFEVWGLDLRGHGLSAAGETFGGQGMGDDVLAAVRHLRNGGSPIHAFGHSMGGAAVLIATRSEPGLLASAYIYEPAVFPRHAPGASPGNTLGASARRRRDTFPSRAEALWRYASRPPLDRWRADALAAYVEHGFAEQADGSVVLRCRPEHEAAMFEDATALSLEDLPDLAPPPTVVAMGHHDGTPGPSAVAPIVAERLAGARLEVFARLGHFGPVQDPELIAAAVAAHALG